MKSLTTTAKKLTSVSMLLLTIPFLFFVSALLQNVLNVGFPPNAWLEEFNQRWLRIATFAFVMILLPASALILNLFSIRQLQNNDEQTRIRVINYTVVVITGFVVLLFTIVMLADTTSGFSQNADTTSNSSQGTKTITPDFSKLIKEKRLSVFNRNATVLTNSQNQNGIHLDTKDNYGVAWLNDVRFSNGSLEFDVKGKNVMQQSFVGIAFHGLDDKTMDAIYFRPFNFQSQDGERKNHSLQYVSLPDYDWQKLRTDFPNEYEHSLNPSPQPDEWLHVRVVVNTPKISVYVNNNSAPDLVVEQLSNRKDGNVGFWVGSQSDGDFANLKITMQ